MKGGLALGIVALRIHNIFECSLARHLHNERMHVHGSSQEHANGVVEGVVIKFANVY